jgi:hypothetical protein
LRHIFASPGLASQSPYPGWQNVVNSRAFFRRARRGENFLLFKTGTTVAFLEKLARANYNSLTEALIYSIKNQ